MDYIFTVCDQAAGEVCPIWPGHPMSAHWGLPDPAAVEGSEEAQAAAFRATAVALKRRIELMLALPLDRLDAMAIHREVKNIGTR
jgi:protein-tyrosine-phosphatase